MREPTSTPPSTLSEGPSQAEEDRHRGGHKENRQSHKGGRKKGGGVRARRQDIMGATRPLFFFFFKTHYVHGDPVRGPMVRRRKSGRVQVWVS